MSKESDSSNITDVTEIRTISTCKEGVEEVNRLLSEGWVYLNSFSSARVDSKHLNRIGDDTVFVLGNLRE